MTQFSAEAWPLVAGPTDRPRRALGLVWHDPTEPPAAVRIGGQSYEVAWETGAGRPVTGMALIPADGRGTVSVEAGGFHAECLLAAPREWEVFLVPHSHVDIGYTEFPDILAVSHADFIAQALDLMTATDSLPDEQRYRWTCESSWTVEQFVLRHPGRVEEFVRRCRERRMEFTALYCNMTELFGERMVEESVRFAREFRDRHGVELVSACNYDVNGLPWCVPRILDRMGVRYLDTAINETRSLGVRPRPSLFRWESPDGSGVRFWHSRGYFVGTQLLLHLSATRAASRVARFLATAEKDGYPHHGMQMLVCGFSGDNMPPDAGLSRVVGEWNARWLWPRLRIATVRQWHEHLEQRWTAPVQTFRLAWPDWWSDGCGSAATESALSRRVEARLTGLEQQRAVLAELGVEPQGIGEQYREAWRRAMLFAEHTWGPYETAIAPHSPATRGQWHSHAANVYAADGWATSISIEQTVALASGGRASARRQGLTNATLQSEPSGYLAGTDPAAVLVFNPLPQTRTDLVHVRCPGYFSNKMPPRLRDARTGKLVPVVPRPFHPSDVVGKGHWMVDFLAPDLPPRGHGVYWIEPGEEVPPAPPAQLAGDTVDGAHFIIRIDRRSGALASVVHRRTGRELVQPGAPYLLNEFVYEQIDSPEDRYAYTNWGIRKKAPPFRRSGAVMRCAETWIDAFGSAHLAIEATSPAGLRLRTMVTLPSWAERVDITNTLDKPATTLAEAVYHAFPFLGGAGQVHLKVAGGVIRPWLDQVPGTASDWHAVQEWFAVADADAAVVVASPDIPLVQCGGINTGKWLESAPAPNGLVMSWVLNNYWFTNFPVSQEGPITYRYSLRLLEGGFDPAAASRGAAETCRPAWGAAVRLDPAIAARLGVVRA